MQKWLEPSEIERFVGLGCFRPPCGRHRFPGSDGGLKGRTARYWKKVHTTF